MPTAEERADNNVDRAIINAVRGGDIEQAQALLATQQSSRPWTSPPDVSAPSDESPEEGIPVQGAEPVARQRSVSRVFSRLARAERELKALRDWANTEMQNQKAEIDKLRSELTVVRRHGKLIADALEEFHREAKGTRDSWGGQIDGLARALRGYMDGINEGEAPSSPKLLAFARALDASGQKGAIVDLGSTVLTYLAFTDPLSENSGSSASTTTTNSTKLV